LRFDTILIPNLPTEVVAGGWWLKKYPREFSKKKVGVYGTSEMY